MVPKLDMAYLNCVMIIALLFKYFFELKIFLMSKLVCENMAFVEMTST